MGSEAPTVGWRSSPAFSRRRGHRSGLAAVIRSEVTDPYVEIYRRLLLRAIERGQISENVAPRVSVLAEVIPAMTTHRLSAGGDPMGHDFFVAVVDDVVLAAAHAAGR